MGHTSTYGPWWAVYALDLLVETTGLFILTFVIGQTHVAPNLAGLAQGLAVAVLMFALSKFGEADLNPLLTLTHWAWWTVMDYRELTPRKPGDRHYFGRNCGRFFVRLLGQFLGAVAAGGLLRGILGTTDNMSALPFVNKGVSAGFDDNFDGALVVAFVGLVYTLVAAFLYPYHIFHKNYHYVVPLILGSTVTFLVVFSFRFVGSSTNAAALLGIAVFAGAPGGQNSQWSVYLAALIAGWGIGMFVAGLFAVVAYFLDSHSQDHMWGMESGTGSPSVMAGDEYSGTSTAVTKSRVGGSAYQRTPNL